MEGSNGSSDTAALKAKLRELREENIQQHNEFVELAKVNQSMEE